MSTANIKYIGIGKYQDSILLASHTVDKGQKTILTNECNDLLRRLKLLGLRHEERQKVNTSNGSWFCKMDENEIMYMVLCNPSYPERHAYVLIKEAREELEKIPDYHSANKEVISSHAKKFLPSMVNKYNNLVNIDNVHAAQKKADDVIIMMGTNIKNMVDNMENLESLETKASMMKEQAGVFSKDSTNLKKIMRVRSFKMYVIAVLVALAIVAYIVIPIIVRI